MDLLNYLKMLKKILHKNNVLMIGPDIYGLGGISKVCKTWRMNGFFSDYNIKYIASVSDKAKNHVFFLMKALLQFFTLLFLIS